VGRERCGACGSGVSREAFETSAAKQSAIAANLKPKLQWLRG